MKTPDEIKKGLESCLIGVRCTICTYHDIGNSARECTAKLCSETIAYIQQLESRLAQTEKERDAILATIKSIVPGDFMFPPIACKFCRNCDGNFTKEKCEFCQTNGTNSSWQWRGISEKSKENP